MTDTVTPVLSEDQRDCYQEIANVAMGQAADRLARLLNTFVTLPIPQIGIIESSDMRMAIQNIDSSSSVSAVCQGFAGSGITGETLLVFNDHCFTELAALHDHKGPITRQVELELLMDTASILAGVCVKGIGEQLEVPFNQSHPVILGQHCSIDELLHTESRIWKSSLAIDLHYSIENANIDCNLLVLFTDKSVDLLNNKINFLLE